MEKLPFFIHGKPITDQATNGNVGVKQRLRIVMAYKRLEEHSFTWPGIKDGLMTLTHAQFEALFAGLDWRRVHAVRTRTPETIE